MITTAWSCSGNRPIRAARSGGGHRGKTSRSVAISLAVISAVMSGAKSFSIIPAFLAKSRSRDYRLCLQCTEGVLPAYAVG